MADQVATEIARTELVPRLTALVELAREADAPDQVAFFGRIQSTIEHAREDEDLADAFMELSTSAFRGFVYSPAATFLLDQVLELAHQLSMTLSAPTDEEH